NALQRRNGPVDRVSGRRLLRRRAGRAAGRLRGRAAAGLRGEAAGCFAADEGLRLEPAGFFADVHARRPLAGRRPPEPDPGPAGPCTSSCCCRVARSAELCRRSVARYAPRCRAVLRRSKPTRPVTRTVSTSATNGTRGALGATRETTVSRGRGSARTGRRARA